MIKSFGTHALTAAAVLAMGGLGTVAIRTPAHAAGFSAAYTCNIANLGQTAAVLNGWLTAPGTAYSGPSRFQLHISSLNLQSPVPIDSWSANAWINVGGAENTSFLVSGSGGFVPPQGAIAGDLAGDWAPSVAGTDYLRVGGLEITANTSEAGSVPVQCVPNRPQVAEVLRVASPYQGRWIRPTVPVFNVNGWYRPGMVLRPPVWTRPVRPGGWNHPGYPGGWNHPGYPPPHQGGGWNHPGHPGGPPHHHDHDHGHHRF